MKLRYVTLTGADDTVKPSVLADLSAKYPFVEWAILFSQKKSSVSRYPSPCWVREFLGIAREAKLNTSAHLCGKWVDDAIGGNLTFFTGSEDVSGFRRFQLNMGASRLKQAVNNERLIEAVTRQCRQAIFGGNYDGVTLDVSEFKSKAIYPLFDASGGKGIETKDWPKPFYDHNGDPLFCGYAGGLGPDNIADELHRISEVVGDAEIWVDMESKIRSKQDNFDVEKCEKVLQAALPWVG